MPPPPFFLSLILNGQGDSNCLPRKDTNLMDTQGGSNRADLMTTTAVHLNIFDFLSHF